MKILVAIGDQAYVIGTIYEIRQYTITSSDDDPPSSQIAPLSKNNCLVIAILRLYSGAEIPTYIAAWKFNYPSNIQNSLT